MSARFLQLREATRRQIAVNPTVVIPYRRPLVDDGYSGEAQDPFGVAVPRPPARVRLSHESASVPTNRPVPSGLDTNLSLYVLTDYLAPLQEGDTFAAEGRTWRVGVVNVLKLEGRVYATEAPLMPAGSVA